MADISEIVSTNATVEVKHPRTGLPLGLTIHLLPEDSKPLRDLQRKWQTEALKTRGRNLDADKIEARTLERLVTATASWEWGNDENGEPCTIGGEQPDFTPFTARKLYKEYSWLRGQVAEVLSDEAEFFRSSN